jgi:hypothetical protein
MKLHHTLAVTAALLGTSAGSILLADELRQPPASLHVTAFRCPPALAGRPFLYQAEEHINLLRPGTVRLACYYRKGVTA